MAKDVWFVTAKGARPSGFQLHFRSRTHCLSVRSRPAPSKNELLMQINNRSRSRPPHGKSPKSFAEVRRFELRNPVCGRGFQDDLAVIRNPPSFQSSRVVLSTVTSSTVARTTAGRRGFMIINLAITTPREGGGRRRSPRVAILPAPRL